VVDDGLRNPLGVPSRFLSTTVVSCGPSLKAVSEKVPFEATGVVPRLLTTVSEVSDAFTPPGSVTVPRCCAVGNAAGTAVGVESALRSVARRNQFDANRFACRPSSLQNA